MTNLPPLDDRLLVTQSPCPYCGAEQECATGTKGQKAAAVQAGALSFCMDCGEVSVFTDAVGGRRMPRKGEIDAETLVELERIRDAWRRVKGR